MKLPLVIALALMPLAACQEIDEFIAEADAEQQAADVSRCNKQGFANGTNAMATCLSTVSRERQAESDRYAADRRSEDKKRKKKESYDDEGTYRGQTGFDPATANMSMCSDGALREDCRNAPNGY